MDCESVTGATEVASTKPNEILPRSPPMNRVSILLALIMSLGGVLFVSACQPFAATAEGRLHFVEAASPRLSLTAISIL